MWLCALRFYLMSMGLANLLWESLQLPLYTIWQTAPVPGQVFAVLHCTAGDILIGLSALAFGLFIIGHEKWPKKHFLAVTLVTVFLGLAYTIFSEWLNVVVRASWAYSDLMPIVQVFGLRLGLSPLLQWLVIPMGSLMLAKALSTSPA
jgi:hypothetical protein